MKGYLLIASVVGLLLGSVFAQANAWIMQDGTIACDPVIETLEVDNVISHSSAVGTSPENVFDGNESTRWSDSDTTSILQIALDKPKDLCSVDISFYRGDERVNAFTVYVSPDGNSYIKAFEGQSSGSTEAMQHFVFVKRFLSMKHIQVELEPAVYPNGETTTWSSITELMIDRPNPDRFLNISNPEPEPQPSTTDKFGIEKLYPTKNGGNEWYINMNDPDSDSLFRNLPEMTKQSDGSWQVNGGSRGQVRLEAWSESGEKWQNVEITMYGKMISGGNKLFQMYSRGGHHTSSDECLGSAYKARLYGDGHTTFVKEVTHPAYTGNRGSIQATDSLGSDWIGFKAVIYNIVENGKTFVKMESYIDDDVTDSIGNLKIGNNWELASVVIDRGDWSTGDIDFDSTCQSLDLNSSSQYRQRDEILSKPGGTSTQNLAAWRSDDLTWNFKYLSVREINPL